MSHTPGPYFAGDDTGNDCPNHAGGGLAVINTDRADDWPIARHVKWNNVPLLKAAPKLLEALYVVRREVVLPAHIEETICDAIAEAEGEEGDQ